jgi:hypothetical protein
MYSHISKCKTKQNKKTKVAREHILYGFNSFKSVKVCFMAQDIAYLGKCSTCILLWTEYLIGAN